MYRYFQLFEDIIFALGAGLALSLPLRKLIGAEDFGLVVLILLGFSNSTMVFILRWLIRDANDSLYDVNRHTTEEELRDRAKFETWVKKHLRVFEPIRYLWIDFVRYVKGDIYN